MNNDINTVTIDPKDIQTLGSEFGLTSFDLDGTDTNQNATPALEALFSAQKERPEGLGSIDLAGLSPLLRVLLVTDGTVTQCLEAYTLQKVEVILLGQRTSFLSEDNPWLDAPRGTEVIDRQIMLRSAASGLVFGFADSILVTSRLSPSVLDGLIRGEEGIGRLLNRSRAELRRECLWFGREVLRHPPKDTGFDPEQEFLSRSYRMVSGGRPMILINERFPVDLVV